MGHFDIDSYEYQQATCESSPEVDEEPSPIIFKDNEE